MNSRSGPWHDVSHRSRPRWRRRSVAVAAIAAVGLTVGVVGVTRALAATPGTITGIGGKCVDVADANPANGTPVQLYRCNGTNAEQWAQTGTTVQALGKCVVPPKSWRVRYAASRTRAAVS